LEVKNMKMKEVVQMNEMTEKLMRSINWNLMSMKWKIWWN
jgi:hypothetical protein